jgi:RNA recognition motif-containing protein
MKESIGQKGQISVSSVFLSNLSYDVKEEDIENALKNVNINHAVYLVIVNIYLFLRHLALNKFV